MRASIREEGRLLTAMHPQEDFGVFEANIFKCVLLRRRAYLTDAGIKHLPLRDPYSLGSEMRSCARGRGFIFRLPAVQFESRQQTTKINNWLNRVTFL